MFRSVRDCRRGTATEKAAFNAGLLLEHAGATDQARTAFEQAIEAGNPVPLPRAVAHLVRLLLRTHDKDAASALLERWRNADDPTSRRPWQTRAKSSDPAPAPVV